LGTGDIAGEGIDEVRPGGEASFAIDQWGAQGVTIIRVDGGERLEPAVKDGAKSRGGNDHEGADAAGVPDGDNDFARKEDNGQGECCTAHGGDPAVFAGGPGNANTKPMKEEDYVRALQTSDVRVSVRGDYRRWQGRRGSRRGGCVCTSRDATVDFPIASQRGRV
jgi:hypothetical protein